MDCRPTLGTVQIKLKSLYDCRLVFPVASVVTMYVRLSLCELYKCETPDEFVLKEIVLSYAREITETIFQIFSFSFLTLRKRRMVGFLLLFASRAWDVLPLLVFPHDYICAFLVVWKSYHSVPSYFKSRNTSFVIKFKPFPELTDVLSPEQCETSGGYWHKHKLEGVVHAFSQPGFPKIHITSH